MPGRRHAPERTGAGSALLRRACHAMAASGGPPSQVLMRCDGSDAEPAVFEAGTVSLRGLPEHLITEVLFGLQQRTRHGSKTGRRPCGSAAPRAARSAVAG